MGKRLGPDIDRNSSDRNSSSVLQGGQLYLDHIHEAKTY